MSMENNQEENDLARHMSELNNPLPAIKKEFNMSPPRKIRRETYPIGSSTQSALSYPNNLLDRLTSTPIAPEISSSYPLETKPVRMKPLLDLASDFPPHVTLSRRQSSDNIKVEPLPPTPPMPVGNEKSCDKEAKSESSHGLFFGNKRTNSMSASCSLEFFFKT